MTQLPTDDPLIFAALRNTNPHEASAWLITLAALHRGLDVTFYATDAEAGVHLPHLTRPTATARFFSVSDGRRRRFFDGTLSDAVSKSALAVTRDKQRTRDFLMRKKLAVPAGGVVSASKPQALDVLLKAGVREFVIKPLDGSRGKGVFVRQSAPQIRQILKRNPKTTYLVEQFVAGAEYRVVVADGAIMGVTHKVRACVVGNGLDTLASLLAARAKARSVNPVATVFDVSPAERDLALLMQGMTMQQVPRKGQVVWLAPKTVPDLDGDFSDAQAVLPAAARDLAIAAATAVGVPFCGIDMILHPSGSALVLEVNARPMIRMHAFPYPEGSPNLDVPEALLASHFPNTVVPDHPVQMIDFPALRAELFRSDRRSKGVPAVEFLRPALAAAAQKA